MDTHLQKELLGGIALLSLLILSGVGLHVVQRTFKLKVEWIRYYFVLDVLMMMVVVVTSNRVITGEESILAHTGGVQHSVLLSQIFTLLLLVVASERIARALLGGELKQVQTLPLLGATLLFYFIINFLTPLLGLYAEFQHNFLYAPLVALALYAVAQRDGHEPIIRIVRNAYVVFLGLGLAVLLVRPSMMASFNYGEGIIPGFSIRYYGFGTHPNTVAAYCLMLLCCLWACPFERRSINRLGWAIGIISLVLTQSKTSVGLAASMFALMVLMSRTDDLRRLKGVGYRPLTASAAGALAALMALGALGVLVALLTGVIDTDKLAEQSRSDSLLTLTGRTFIWRLSLESLWDNPLFGYGADLWGPAFQQHMQFFVSHAHNQYIHTLGDSGFVGLGALLIYCVALAVYSWRARRQTRWLSVALALYILLRGITEAPLIVDGVFGADFAAHMILLVLCVGGMRLRTRQEASGEVVARPRRPAVGGLAVGDSVLQA